MPRVALAALACIPLIGVIAQSRISGAHLRRGRPRRRQKAQRRRRRAAGSDQASAPYRGLRRHRLQTQGGGGPSLQRPDRCSGTPWGDNWATWNADFFTPAAPLLHRTVWLMARGNHEECSRAGTGFTALLGHDSMPAGCSPHESPLLIDLGGLTLALLDDNAALDKEVVPDVAAALTRDIAAALAAKADWLVTHHPFRGISKPDPRGEPRVMEGANATLLAALSGADESRLTLMLAGHIHNFQIENYGGIAAPQHVIGEGGDALDKEVPLRLTGLVSGGKTVVQGLSLPGFGYAVLDRVRHTRDWNITVHSADGGVIRHCALVLRKLQCEARLDRRTNAGHVRVAH